MLSTPQEILELQYKYALAKAFHLFHLNLNISSHQEIA